MKIDEIKLLFDYNDWADARILAACARVNPEQYAAPAAYGRGGLRAIMVHILDNLWQTRQPTTPPSFTKMPFRLSPCCRSAGKWNKRRCRPISTD